MKLDFDCDQGLWLDKTIEDRSVNGGICHAISMDWAVEWARRRPFDLETARFLAVSGQRAYNMAIENPLKDKWSEPKYGMWLTSARTPTENFARSFLRGRSFNLETRKGLTLTQLKNEIKDMPGSRAFIIILWGSNKKKRLDGQNWGHTIAVARGPGRDAGFGYFDANQGQFSWPKGTQAITIANEVVDNIIDEYSPSQIRDIDIYILSR